MANITDKDRIKEYENMKDMLDSLEIACEILPKNALVEQSSLLISLPTSCEDWETEFETDMHVATGQLIQLSDDEQQLTKYLMLYVPIQVDVKGLDELVLLRLMNEVNSEIPIGTCFCAEEPGTGRLLLQIKWLIGGFVGEYIEEAVLCEALFEIGSVYDEVKEKLVELVEQAQD